MKSLLTKLFAILFIAALAVGCASSITAPQQLEKKEVKKEITINPGTTQAGESEMNPIRTKPEL